VIMPHNWCDIDKKDYLRIKKRQYVTLAPRCTFVVKI
jgi:hypothetical protein